MPPPLPPPLLTGRKARVKLLSAKYQMGVVKLESLWYLSHVLLKPPLSLNISSQ